MTTLHERMRSLTSDHVGRTLSDLGHDTEAVDERTADIKLELHRMVIEAVGPRLYREETQGSEELENAVREAVAAGLATVDAISVGDRRRIEQDLVDDILCYGPITGFLRDENITEVMVNSFDRIYVERKGRIQLTNASFVDEPHLERIIQKIVSEVGRRIDESSPMVDARLHDGSRVNAIVRPLAIDGACLTIRKFRSDPYTLEDLVRMGTLTDAAAQFLKLSVRGGANVLVAGGTGSGKTTTLNVLSSAIPEDERIITIEDAAELRLTQEHVIRLEARPNNIEGRGRVSIRELLSNSLRMRPDRIIVGECRGPEAIDMLQAMNTGHDGSMTTVHANSAREALMRVETLVLMSGIELPIRAIREQVAGAFDLLVHVDRLVDGSRRITSITEVVGMESDVVTIQDIFAAKHEEGSESGRLLGPLRMTGVIPGFLPKLATNGVRIPESLFRSGGTGSGRWMLGDRE